MSEVVDVLGLPQPDGENIIQSCIPYLLDTSKVEVGQKLSLKVSITSAGNIPEHYIQDDCRVQLIIPVSDPNFEDDPLPDWYPVMHNNNLLIERKTWTEGIGAEVFFEKTGCVNELPLHIMVVIDNGRIDFRQFRIKIEATKKSQNRRNERIATQFIRFDSECEDWYGGDDETLMEIFAENGGFNLIESGSMFHPKQLHSYNAIRSHLIPQINSSKQINITYVGPDTCENLHSVLRLINNLVGLGLSVGCFYFIHKQWDERSMDKIKILSPDYFSEAGLEFKVQGMPVESRDVVSSDLIITTYVTSWAYSSKIRGSSTDQYLNDIIKRIKDEHTLILSIDPVNVHKVARSFNSMVYHGKPSDVFELSGLQLQDTAPGGYGDVILHREREVCWVTSYKKTNISSVRKLEKPRPNDLAKLSETVYPAGREAIIERLIKPKLRYVKQSEYLENSSNEDVDLWECGENIEIDSIESPSDKFGIIVGGPGDGKSVFLQQLLVNKLDNEDEISVLLTARSLANEVYINTLSMREGEEKIAHFIELIEKECCIRYPKLSWNSHIQKWLGNEFKLNLYIDALDEVRDSQSRNEVFTLLNLLSNNLGNVSVKVSMRENILLETLRNFTKNDKHKNSSNNKIIKIEWDENRLTNSFIPSLLHGWNLKLDNSSQKELALFLKNSKRSIRNKNNDESRIFLKNPLRAVWLVNFVYDQSIDLKNMRVSKFEDDILRLSVKNRYENRRLDGMVLPENILDELLDILGSIAVLDYGWSTGCIDFTEDNRNKFIEHAKLSSVSKFLRSKNTEELKQFFFEDMSLLYVTDRDNLAWVHENLREHAVARGLLGYSDGTLCKELIDQWDMNIPNLEEVFLNYQSNCSLELSDAIRRKISNRSLFEYTRNWINSWSLSNGREPLIINLPFDDSNHLRCLNDLLSYVSRVESELKILVDKQNNNTVALTTERDKLNKIVKQLNAQVANYRKDRDGKNTLVRKLKSERKNLSKQIRMLKEQNLSDSNVRVSKELSEAIKSHSNNFEKSQEYADKAQSVHDELKKTVEESNRIREEASGKHKEMRASKKIADTYYRSYVLIKFRIKREIIHRKNEILGVNELNPTIDYEQQSTIREEILSTIIDYYSNEDVKYVSPFGNDIFDDIRIDFTGSRIDICIESVNAAALIGKSGHKVDELSRKLSSRYNQMVVIHFRPTDLSQDYVKTLIERELNQFLIDERTGDYEIDISGYEFEPFTNPKDIHEEFPNRFVTLVSRNPNDLGKSGLIATLQRNLKMVIGRPFIVSKKGIDLDSSEVKEAIIDSISEYSESDIFSDMYVMPLENSKGRRVVMQVSNVNSVKDYIDEIELQMLEKYGHPFDIKLVLNQDEVKHLDKSQVEEKTIEIIHELYPLNTLQYELVNLETKDLNGIENRRIVVYGKPFLALIGKNGDILHKIKSKLKSELGEPINFHSLPPVPSKPDLLSEINQFISNLENKPDGFEVKSIHIGDNYRTKSKQKQENRKITIDTTHRSFIRGKLNININNLFKLLRHKFDGDFFLQFKRPDAKNLDSKLVINHLRKIINQHIDALEGEEEFVVQTITTAALDGVSGRKIKVKCSRPNLLIGNNGVYIQEFTRLMEDYFGSPIVINIEGDHESIEIEIIKPFMKTLLDDHLGNGQYRVEFRKWRGSNNRWIKLYTSHDIENQDRETIRRIVSDEFKGPIKFSFLIG